VRVGGVLSLTDKVDSPQLTQAELDALVDSRGWPQTAACARAEAAKARRARRH